MAAPDSDVGGVALAVLVIHQPTQFKVKRSINYGRRKIATNKSLPGAITSGFKRPSAVGPCDEKNAALFPVKTVDPEVALASEVSLLVSLPPYKSHEL